MHTDNWTEARVQLNSIMLDTGFDFIELTHEGSHIGKSTEIDNPVMTSSVHP